MIVKAEIDLGDVLASVDLDDVIELLMDNYTPFDVDREEVKDQVRSLILNGKGEEE